MKERNMEELDFLFIYEHKVGSKSVYHGTLKRSSRTYKCKNARQPPVRGCLDIGRASQRGDSCIKFGAADPDCLQIIDYLTDLNVTSRT